MLGKLPNKGTKKNRKERKRHFTRPLANVLRIIQSNRWIPCVISVKGRKGEMKGKIFGMLVLVGGVGGDRRVEDVRLLCLGDFRRDC